MKIRRILSLLAAAALLVFAAGCAPEEPAAQTEETFSETTEATESTQAQETTAPAPGPWDMSTMEIVEDMGIGINLGNTYDAYGDWVDQWGDGSVESYVTCWGSPVITQQMIQGYADEGFGVLRIPVHWFNLMSDDYVISEEYMASVQQTVDWALDAGMYVIVNIHHDQDGFFAGFPSDTENRLQAYAKIWEQIAGAFRDYDHRLILESLNEEGCWDSLWNRWGGDSGKAEAYGILNAINQTFVDTVRASGGNNAQRHLLIAGYATDVAATCDELFRMPEDPAGHCAVSIHYYSPPGFAILEEDADWGKASTTWGSEAELRELNANLDMLTERFVSQGIPVIMGEYGCPKNNKDEQSVLLYLSSVCQAARQRHICPILWDITGVHYDRDTCKMVDPLLREALMAVE